MTISPSEFKQIRDAMATLRAADDVDLEMTSSDVDYTHLFQLKYRHSGSYNILWNEMCQVSEDW